MTPRHLVGLKKDLWLRDKHCHYCRRRLPLKAATLDHYFPRSAGGGDVPWNCVLACEKCNREKGAKVPKEALRG